MSQHIGCAVRDGGACTCGDAARETAAKLELELKRHESIARYACEAELSHLTTVERVRVLRVLLGSAGAS